MVGHGCLWPHLHAQKVEFLQELVDITELHVGPRVVLGYFNLIMNPKDKNNNAVSRRMLSRFRSKLNQLELKEVYLNGRHYTWSNERGCATLERIDHIFAIVD